MSIIVLGYMTFVLLLHEEDLYAFVFGYLHFLRLANLHVALFCCGGRLASAQRPHLWTRPFSNIEQTAHVRSMSLRVWAELVGATE